MGSPIMGSLAMVRIDEEYSFSMLSSIVRTEDSPGMTLMIKSPSIT